MLNYKWDIIPGPDKNLASDHNRRQIFFFSSPYLYDKDFHVILACNKLGWGCVNFEFEP